MIAGGKCDDSKGYFVEPTIVESKDPHDAIMSEVKDLTLTWAHLEDAIMSEVKDLTRAHLEDALMSEVKDLKFTRAHLEDAIMSEVKDLTWAHLEDAIMSEVKDLTFTWAHLEDAVGRDNVFPVGSVLKPEVGTLLRLTG